MKVRIVACVLVLAACSSASTKKPPATTTTATAAVPDKAADVGLASNIVLHAGDLPSEWAPQTHQKDPTDAQGAAELAACLGIPDSRPDRTADVDSDDYSMGTFTISSNVGVLPDSTPVERDMAAYAGPKSQGCFGDVVRKVFASSQPSGQLTSVDISVSPGPAPGRPDQRALVTAHFVATIGGVTADVWTAAVYLAHGRTEAEVDVVNDGPTAIDPSMVELAASRVATRLAASPA